MAEIIVPIIVFLHLLWFILVIHYRWGLWPVILSALITLFLVLSFHGCTDNEKLPGGFVYNSQRKDIIGRFDIPSTIISYEYYNDFIFIEQVPKYPIQTIYNIEYYDYSHNDGRLFWIIDITKEKPIGPMDSASFYKYKDSVSPNKNLTRDWADQFLREKN